MFPAILPSDSKHSPSAASSGWTASSRQKGKIAPGLPKDLLAGDICTCFTDLEGTLLKAAGEPRAECPFQARTRWDTSRKWLRTSQTNVLKQHPGYNQEAKQRELCGCDYQEGCLEAAAKLMRDTEVRGRVSAKASLRDL